MTAQRRMSTVGMASVVILAISAQLMAGTTYYVDQGHPNCGGNGAAGTEDNPFCYMGSGVSRLQQGDDLIVKEGTYTQSGNESHYLGALVGTEADPVEIKVAPGHSVTLRGPDYQNGRVKITRSHYVVFDGFRITNFNQGLFIEDASSHITIQNCTIDSVGQEGLHIKQHSHHILIQNNVIHDTRKFDYNGEGIYVGTGSGTGSGALKDTTHHVVIRNNTIYNTKHEAIELKPGTSECIVEGNHIYNIQTQIFYETGAIEIGEHSLGDQFLGVHPNHIVRNNVIHAADIAIRVSNGALIYNNVIYDLTPGSYGILQQNRAGDSYVRRIYHNTIDLPSSRAIRVQAGLSDIKNNIGPSGPDNMETNSAFFVSTQQGSEDYHLAPPPDPASPGVNTPIDAGVGLPVTVSDDIDGNARPVGSASDYGAYEFGSGAPADKVAPAAPTNLRVER